LVNFKLTNTAMISTGIHVTQEVKKRGGLGLWCLTPLSKIF